MLGNLIGGFIVIVVGVNLVPTVADGVWAATAGGNYSATNLSSAAGTIIGLTTLFFTLAVASAGIAVASQGLRSAGLLGV